MKRFPYLLLLCFYISLSACFPFKIASVKGVHLAGWDYTLLQKVQVLRAQAKAYKMAGDYQNCVNCCQQIFSLGIVRTEDYHHAAQAYCKLNKPDSVFICLNGYVKMKTANPVSLAFPPGQYLLKDDSAFLNLWNDNRWKKITDTLDKCMAKFNAGINKDLQAELIKMTEMDQSVRTGDDKINSKHGTDNVDTMLQLSFDKIVTKYGVPGISMVGPDGIIGVLLIVQHYGPAGMKKYYLSLKQLTDKGEFPFSLLAYLEDRNNVFNDSPQVYGTQLLPNRFIPWAIITKKSKVYPIAEVEYVDIRRNEAGMGPLGDEMKANGIKYKQGKL